MGVGILEVLRQAMIGWLLLEQETCTSGILRYGFEYASAMQEEIAGSTSATAGAGQHTELLYGAPNAIRLDNGPELVSQMFTEWAAAKSIAIQYIQPGKPNQNAFIERFNRTYRTEVLDAYLFTNLEQVQTITDQWLVDYNEYRPHEALGNIPPVQFMPRLTRVPNLYRTMST